MFAETRRAERRASTAAVDGRLPLRLEKGERRDYHRASLQQIVRSTSLSEVVDDSASTGCGGVLGGSSKQATDSRLPDSAGRGSTVLVAGTATDRQSAVSNLPGRLVPRIDRTDRALAIVARVSASPPPKS